MRGLLSRALPRVVSVGAPWRRLSLTIALPCRFASRVYQHNARRAASTASEADSTIYALSTAIGRAAIAVVRVSGPGCKQVNAKYSDGPCYCHAHAFQIYRSLCPKTPFPKPRVAAVRSLYHPELQEDDILDARALILYFPSPKTVTGEDVLELHTHGGPATVKAVLGAIDGIKLQDQDGSGMAIRYAEPGEFTRRAFMNGRLDLPQIEALGDTLSADTEQQRLLAVRGTTSDSSLSRRYEQWYRQLLYARGELEAMIDFSEDQHFDESSEDLIASVASQVRVLEHQIGLHIQNAGKGELLRNGIRVALLGAPNVGKSSLLNLIVGREAAIVSTEEGTTRDIVDVGVDLGGWYCKLGDMAGIRSEYGDNAITIGAVEKEGIRRARARALASDLVIVVLSLERDTTTAGGCWKLPVEKEVLDSVGDCARAGKRLLVVVNKCDNMLGEGGEYVAELVNEVFPTTPRQRVFAISCLEAQEQMKTAASVKADPGNIKAFLNGVISIFEEMVSPLSETSGQHDIGYWEDSLGVTHRQSSNLQRCQEHLQDFLQATGKEPESVHHDGDEIETDIVMAAEHLRFAAEALAKITGKGESGDVEDILGVVFEKCAFLTFLHLLFGRTLADGLE